MNTSQATKQGPEGSSHVNSAMLAVFYLLTFLTGGFFLFAGGRLGLVVDLGAAMLYIAVTVLFYLLSTGSKGNEPSTSDMSIYRQRRASSLDCHPPNSLRYRFHSYGDSKSKA